MSPNQYAETFWMAHKDTDLDGLWRDGRGNLLQEFEITRADGSAFSIHQEVSEVRELKKYTITEQGRDLTVYSEGIDYHLLYTDPNYVNAIGDSLLSRERIAAKKEESMKNEVTSYIYAGRIGLNEQNQYHKFAKEYSGVCGIINRGIEEEKKREEEERKRIEAAQQKNAMIESITASLNDCTIEQLMDISKFVKGLVKSDLDHTIGE